MADRIVITGMGIVTPLGIGVEQSWNDLVAGKSGAAPITRFDASGFKTTFGCEVKGFDPLDYMDRKEAKRMDLFCQFAIAASEEAIVSSGLDLDNDIDRDRIGVLIGSGIGGMTTYESQIIRLSQLGPRKVSPFFIPMMIGDIASGQVSIKWNFSGPNYAVQSACATASHAIGLAYMHLQAGDADVMLCGGSEAPINATGVAGFNSMHAISTRNAEPEKASRPFDIDRDGFVIGEGAGIFILETEEHALKRGAKILGELAGYGFSGDAYHLTAPAPGGTGAVKSMQAAMKKAGCKPEDIDYINAHGTSTPHNDQTETAAIKTAFGDHAYNLAVSSTKSMTGHLLGAAGAVEMFVSLMAVRTGIIPPTINLDNPDPECDLFYVPNKSVKRDVETSLSNTFGFGGHNASIIVRRWDN
ncbi:MAG: beta-ketoacyl-ACP synthase II [Candidatus Electryonea clarkiae]|nr:beta-ketoacyl-ACP synthase II [Candidatus Electryonea clarkiae]MDP8287382.1 beta-ketoacyl-ACP synthase II [Candidatus Electryonea clarkiae]